MQTIRCGILVVWGILDPCPLPKGHSESFPYFLLWIAEQGLNVFQYSRVPKADIAKPRVTVHGHTKEKHSIVDYPLIKSVILSPPQQVLTPRALSPGEGNSSSFPLKLDPSSKLQKPKLQCFPKPPGSRRGEQ